MQYRRIRAAPKNDSLFQTHIRGELDRTDLASLRRLSNSSAVTSLIRLVRSARESIEWITEIILNYPWEGCWMDDLWGSRFLTGADCKCIQLSLRASRSCSRILERRLYYALQG